MKSVKIKVHCFFLVSMFMSYQSVKAANTVERIGDVLQVLLPVTGYIVTQDVSDPEGRSQLFESLFSTLAITFGLKLTVNKERPNGGSYSFPSGHTSAAFCGAAFMQKRYGWKYGIPAYLLASFVGYSRVESNHHYWEDVAAGTFLGVVCTYFFTKPFGRMSLKPVALNDCYGIYFQIKW